MNRLGKILAITTSLAVSVFGCESTLTNLTSSADIWLTNAFVTNVVWFQAGQGSETLTWIDDGDFGIPSVTVTNPDSKMSFTFFSVSETNEISGFETLKSRGIFKVWKLKTDKATNEIARSLIKTQHRKISTNWVEAKDL